jgi:hypothetical protein
VQSPWDRRLVSARGAHARKQQKFLNWLARVHSAVDEAR